MGRALLFSLHLSSSPLVSLPSTARHRVATSPLRLPRSSFIVSITRCLSPPFPLRLFLLVPFCCCRVHPPSSASLLLCLSSPPRHASLPLCSTGGDADSSSGQHRHHSSLSFLFILLRDSILVRFLSVVSSLARFLLLLSLLLVSPVVVLVVVSSIGVLVASFSPPSPFRSSWLSGVSCVQHEHGSRRLQAGGGRQRPGLQGQHNTHLTHTHTQHTTSTLHTTPRTNPGIT